ncbi:MAG: penicillin-binding protein activator [Proteobacteria bacterium]|nr:penicillin-binding protein activator [Pseudomonadota bacterium]
MFAKRPLCCLVCLVAGVLCLLACPKSLPAALRMQEKYQPVDDRDAQAAFEQAMGILEAQGAGPGLTALFEVAERYPKTLGAQRALWEAGRLAYARGDYALTRQLMSRFMPGAANAEREIEARRLWGMSALHLYALEEAQALLRPILSKLSAEHRAEAENALARANAGGNAGDALVLAADAWAKAPAEQTYQALLEELELRADMEAVWHASAKLGPGHAAWPLIQWKLGKLFWHIGERNKAKECFSLLVQKASSSPFAQQAQALLARMEHMEQTNPKRIGVLLPLSGRFRALGEDVRRGLELALKGSGLELVVLDNQGDAVLTGQQVEQLVEAQAIAIIGPLLGDDSRRAAQVAESLQVPLLTLSRADNITLLGGYIFRNMLTAKAQVRALLEWSRHERGAKSAAVLFPGIPFGEEMVEAFWEEALKAGIPIQGAERYAFDQTTFSDEVKRLVGRYFLEERHDYISESTRIRQSTTDDFGRRKAFEKLRSQLPPIVDFDVLFIPDSWQRVGLIAPALAVEDIITNACDTKDLERIRKTTKRRDFKTVTLLGPSTWASPYGSSGQPLLLERGGKFVMCSIYVDGFFESSQRKATRVFSKAYRDSYEGKAPSLLSAMGFDSGLLLKAALATGVQTREALRRALMDVKVDGAAGTKGFDAQREAKRELFFLQIGPKGVYEIQMKGES